MTVVSTRPPEVAAVWWPRPFHLLSAYLCVERTLWATGVPCRQPIHKEPPMQCADWLFDAPVPTRRPVHHTTATNMTYAVCVLFCGLITIFLGFRTARANQCNKTSFLACLNAKPRTCSLFAVLPTCVLCKGRGRRPPEVSVMSLRMHQLHTPYTYRRPGCADISLSYKVLKKSYVFLKLTGLILLTPCPPKDTPRSLSNACIGIHC